MMLAFGVCFPRPCSRTGRRFAASRIRLHYYRRIVFCNNKFDEMPCKLDSIPLRLRVGSRNTQPYLKGGFQSIWTSYENIIPQDQKHAAFRPFAKTKWFESRVFIENWKICFTSHTLKYSCSYFEWTWAYTLPPERKKERNEAFDFRRKTILFDSFSDSAFE